MPSADLSARGYSDRNYGTCAPRKRDACLRSARLSRCAGSSIVLLFVALILRGAAKFATAGQPRPFVAQARRWKWHASRAVRTVQAHALVAVGPRQRLFRIGWTRQRRDRLACQRWPCSVDASATFSDGLVHW